MKRYLKHLQHALPWLLLLLGMDVFSSFLLWVVDSRAFPALSAAILLTSLLLFSAVSAVLACRGNSREKAFLAFLETPDEYQEELLLKSLGASQAHAVRLLGANLRERRDACRHLETRLEEYEEYVESWAHETKMPLSLLSLLLDNRRDSLPEPVVHRLDYVRNRMQEFIDQMLYYARLKSARKDYLFERFPLLPCIREILEDYRPLLEEKQFRITLPSAEAHVYTDRRGLLFLIRQLVSNSVKYSAQSPALCFDYREDASGCRLDIRDNGTGVKACDLPYIFEKGFTGDSGENRKRATGMGLYLAAEIAREIGLSLEASSQWGQGFEIRISFPKVETPANLTKLHRTGY